MISSGTSCNIKYDIVVGGQVAFRAGEIVIVEDVSPNSERPEYKYVVTSRLLQRKFQLSENDLKQTSSAYAPAPTPTPPAQYTQVPQPRQSGRGKWVAIALVAIVLIIGIAVYATDNEKSNRTNTQSEVTETEDTYTSPQSASEEEVSEPAPAPVNSPKMTLAEFEQIQNGMTYEQVVNIVGGPGTKMSEVGAPGEEYYTVMYTWEGEGMPGANANAMFQAGAMEMKAQFGLE